MQLICKQHTAVVYMLIALSVSQPFLQDLTISIYLSHHTQPYGYSRKVRLLRNNHQAKHPHTIWLHFSENVAARKIYTLVKKIARCHWMNLLLRFNNQSQAAYIFNITTIIPKTKSNLQHLSIVSRHTCPVNQQQRSPNLPYKFFISQIEQARAYPCLPLL